MVDERLNMMAAESPNLNAGLSGSGSFSSRHQSPNASRLQRGNSGPKNVLSGYSKRHLARQEALESFLACLRARGTVDVDQPGFVESMKEHFDLLPSRYATNVNTTSLDVLNHKRLLDSARSDPSAVSFQVRPVSVLSESLANRISSYGSFGSSHTNSLQHQKSGVDFGSYKSLPRPAFGSSPNLQALLLEAEDKQGSNLESGLYNFYEVTIASVDQSKLLSRLSECLSDIGLNICEAHAFNTKDKFVLDVFVVNGWQDEGVRAIEFFFVQVLCFSPCMHTCACVYHA